MPSPSDEQQEPSQDLIVYRLDELKEMLKEGFARLDGLDDRVASLERWRSRREGQADGPAVPRVLYPILTMLGIILAAFGGHQVS